MNTLFNEYKEKLQDNTTLLYGVPNPTINNIISIIVKGKFTPIENKKDYSDDITLTIKEFLKEGNNILSNTDWIEPFFIFKPDFTEKGIKYNKSCKFKYQLLIRTKPFDNIKINKENILILANTLNKKLNNIFNLNNLSISL